MIVRSIVKKVIVYLLGFIVLLVIVFLCLGIFVPTIEYTTTVDIDKPRDTTWNVMRTRKDWIYGFKSLEPINGGGPDQVGSKAKLTVVRDGRETTFESELTAINPPEMVATRLTNQMLTHEAVVHLSEKNGKTKVVSNEKITGSNLFFRSIFFLFKGSILDISRKNFEALKQAVESSQ